MYEARIDPYREMAPFFLLSCAIDGMTNDNTNNCRRRGGTVNDDQMVEDEDVGGGGGGGGKGKGGKGEKEWACEQCTLLIRVGKPTARRAARLDTRPGRGSTTLTEIQDIWSLLSYKRDGQTQNNSVNTLFTLFILYTIVNTVPYLLLKAEINLSLSIFGINHKSLHSKKFPLWLSTTFAGSNTTISMLINT
jgi:hypothetical protein